MVLSYTSNLLVFTFPDSRESEYVFSCTLPSYSTRISPVLSCWQRIIFGRKKSCRRWERACWA